MSRFVICLARRFSLVCGMLLIAVASSAQIQLFHDRAIFGAALGGFAAVRTDDFESYAQGPISVGDMQGDFLYSFDPNITQPAIVPGGNGGQALGGSPFDVFVAGDFVTLSFQPLSPGAGPFLMAFGADFLYAPSSDDIPANTYGLGLVDGTATGQFVGNLDGLDGGGGTFFLGIIADPAAIFTTVTLFSTQVDPTFLVPAYQVDNLTYAAVPEPGAFALFTASGVAISVFAALCRRRSLDPIVRPSISSERISQ